MPEIKKIYGGKILNSRGDWTICVFVETDSGKRRCFAVPEGKSRGSYEAEYVSPDDALKDIEERIAPALIGKDPSAQEEIDKILIELDGTPNKKNLGGNAILGVSIACAKVAALENGQKLWSYLGELFSSFVSASVKTSADKKASEDRGKYPRLFMNLINGGLHAGNNLDFQEYMIIPKTADTDKALEIGSKFYHALKDYLEKNYGKSAINIGDEGGFAPSLSQNDEPFVVFKKVAKDLGLENEIDFGIDAAASNIKNKSPEELFEFYRLLKKEFNIFYIEDPFGEDDFENFAKLKDALGKDTLITGDDLTATNLERAEEARNKNAINSIIVKPNQIGTLTETLKVISFAKEAGWKVIISHRSGETNDYFIADLAVAVGADGLKSGAPARGERVVKYNRLLHIFAAEYVQ